MTVVGMQELGIIVLAIQLVGRQELGVTVEIKDEQLSEIVEILVEKLVSVIVVGGKTIGGSVVVFVITEQVDEIGGQVLGVIVEINDEQLPETVVVEMGGQVLGVIDEIDEQLPEIVEILVSVIVVGGKMTGGSVVVFVTSEHVVETGQKLGQW